MKTPTILIAMTALGTAGAVWAATPTVDAMRWHNRVLLIAADDPRDGKASEQRRMLSHWKRGAQERDIALVEVTAGRVTGASDSAPSLSKRYDLSGKPFHVLLIGKDGKVALRSSSPIPAGRMQAVIDAMPMRRAGER